MTDDPARWAGLIESVVASGRDMPLCGKVGCRLCQNRADVDTGGARQRRDADRIVRATLPADIPATPGPPQ